MVHYVNLPLTEEKAKMLRAGDTVYLTGEVYTSRDAGHKRMVELLEKGAQALISQCFGSNSAA